MKEDLRPPFMLEDVKGAEFNFVKAQHAPRRSCVCAERRRGLHCSTAAHCQTHVWIRSNRKQFPTSRRALLRRYEAFGILEATWIPRSSRDRWNTCWQTRPGMTTRFKV